MKKGAKWASPALLIIGIWMAFSSCSKPKPLHFRGLSQFQLEKADMDSATVLVQMDFSNPNSYRLDFKSVDGDIFANGHLVGHYHQDTVTHIEPNVDFHYPARITLSTKPILQNALAAFLNRTVELRFAGSAKVGRRGFFISVPLDFKQKQKLNF